MSIQVAASYACQDAYIDVVLNHNSFISISGTRYIILRLGAYVERRSRQILETAALVGFFWILSQSRSSAIGTYTRHIRVLLLAHPLCESQMMCLDYHPADTALPVDVGLDACPSISHSCISLSSACKVFEAADVPPDSCWGDAGSCGRYVVRPWVQIIDDE